MIMKRPISILFIALLSVSSISHSLAAESAVPEPGTIAEPFSANPPDYKPIDFTEIPGAFAIYHDTRSGGDSYVGLCFLGGNELAVRLFEVATKNELLFTLTWYESAGVAEPGTISLVKGSFGSSALAGRVISLVKGMASQWLSSRARFDEEPDFTVGDSGGMYDFRYWVPVFRLYSSGLEREDPVTGRGAVTLATAGVAQSGTDPAFYAYRGFPQVKTGPVDTILPGEARTASVDGYTVSLDSNWSEGTDGIWRISRAGAQDAAFLIETLNLADYGDRDVFDIIRLLVLESGWQLVPGELRIFVFNECPCVYYRVFDPETETITVQYKMFIAREDTRFSMVSLSIYEPLYEANREYFDSILF